jgi:CheY-specific phosphatase CheX/CheY-like chemotaxis protein
MPEQRKSILIVDDDADFRTVLVDMIRGAVRGVQIVESNDGAEAFFKIDKQCFDLVVTDIKMPRMDGHAMLRRVLALPDRQRPRAVLVMSGEASDKEVELELGSSVPYLPKPSDSKLIIETVNRLLSPQNGAEAAKSGGASPHPAGNAPVDTPRVDASFIEPFVQASVTVLKLTAQTEATRDQVFIRKKDQMSGDISALISMNSDIYLGSMAISFELATFLAVVEGMLGEKYAEINAENQDACAELCNQIFGMAKKVLNERGHTIQSAIPSVVVGPAHTLKHSAKGPCIAVRFKTAAGFFTVEAVVEPRVP